MNIVSTSRYTTSISFKKHLNNKNEDFSSDNEIKNTPSDKHPLNSKIVSACLSALLLATQGCQLIPPNNNSIYNPNTDTPTLVMQNIVSANDIKPEKQDILKFNNLSDKDYSSKRDDFIIQLENDGVLNDKSKELKPFDDGASIGIGYGLDLLHNRLDDIKTHLKSADITFSESDQTLIRELGPMARKQDADGSATRKKLVKKLHLYLASEKNARKVLDSELDLNSETRINKYINTKIAKSNERIAFLSILYNSDPSIITENLNKALSEGNRFRAWYEIRYHSNTKIDAVKDGIASRRYQESDMFGLFNDGDATKSEAKTFLDFLNSKDPYDNNYKVIETIREHEKTYNTKNSSTESIDDTVKKLINEYKFTDYNF
ncbi:MAG: hypothetical protein WCK67_00140 [bacterium]